MPQRFTVEQDPGNAADWQGRGLALTGLSGRRRTDSEYSYVFGQIAGERAGDLGIKVLLYDAEDRVIAADEVFLGARSASGGFEVVSHTGDEEAVRATVYLEADEDQGPAGSMPGLLGMNTSPSGRRYEVGLTLSIPADDPTAAVTNFVSVASFQPDQYLYSVHTEDTDEFLGLFHSWGEPWVADPDVER